MSTATPTFPPGYAEQDKGPQVVAVGITFIVLEFAFVLLRFVSRRFNRTALGLDDLFTIPGLLFCWGVCIIAIVEVKVAGVGQHMDVLEVYDPAAVTAWAKCGYAVEELYCIAVVFPKLSILWSYLRIFTMKAQRITVYVLAGIICATAFAGVVTSLASCHPFSARWNPELTTTNCINYLNFWRWISFPNIVTDLVMLWLPLPVIWHLHVSKNQKYGLVAVFLMGSIGIIASIVRFTLFFDVKSLEDGTYSSAELAIWSLVEPGVYLIAACLPCLRPLMLIFFRWVTGNSAYKNTDKYGSNFSGSRTGRSGRGIPLQSNTSRSSKMENSGARGAGQHVSSDPSDDSLGLTKAYTADIRPSGSPDTDGPRDHSLESGNNGIMVHHKYEVYRHG